MLHMPPSSVATPTTLASAPCPNCGSVHATRLYRKELGRDWYLARCAQCSQHYTDPHPTLGDMATFYGGEYHQELLTRDGSLAAFGPKFERYIDWILRWVKPGRALDIGCSTGLFSYLLQRRGFDAEGLEFNAATAEFGRREFGIKISNQPLESAAYEEGAFRLISMTDVLEHSLHPPTALERVHALLEPKGFALITFPDIHSLESLYFRTLARLTRRDWLWQTCHVPAHTWEFTRPTAEALFRKSGFRVVAFRRSHLILKEERSTLMKLLYLPSRLLTWGPLAERFGTQMEFLLQKE